MEGVGMEEWLAGWRAEAGKDVDLSTRCAQLERALELGDMVEEFLEGETTGLEVSRRRAAEELGRLCSAPLVVGQVVELLEGSGEALVSSSTGSHLLCRVMSTLPREELRPGATVGLHKFSNALVCVAPSETDPTGLGLVKAEERPTVTYADLGGLESQKQEVREAVELPLSQKDLYREIGIQPPRGVLFYGPPGTGKTMLAKALAHHTKASFISVVGSELVQKYLGEGPRMVRDLFRLAREKAPSIVFIDEVDSIATKRFDAQTGADREVQRILIELLNQMDGFDETSDVKVIMATNRADTLDPALLRPGRLDRKVEFPRADRRQKRLVYLALTGRMALGPEVDLEELIAAPDQLSAAEIANVCQEAGLAAARDSRYLVLSKDFHKAHQALLRSRPAPPLPFYK